ncbi:MAG: LysE family translocator [Confluentimicrobium sp.]|jgi:threonine/homoserine/homoserine lactone efflux protein|uniref:LysE family translocator n=1 Tax=Actibacterium sp. TaxID=1872125 RepID=UPI0005101779|nr:LysE family translocator [Actibacterium sp.]KGB83601.1 amino acid transporter LysE [Rhodovulum sp. NI22]MBC56910.1 LysE family translocator [Actibacterium sp.]MDY6859261.1 LysE family translocator [Pseudomonadota bacterium]|tara:strand:- start:4147 stop:4767 length:621 start_codon:yes stop_codon:yes gene_type:complete
MTVTAADLALYAGALVILFFTPGPVWVALTARALSGGFPAAWPLALGVVIGDALWPLLAIFGVSWIVSVFAGFMTVLRFVASGVFLLMGIVLIRNADKSIATDSRLTRPGMWAGFLAGLAVILGNPKAILFYMGVLPGFFDLTTITGPDMAAIVAISMLVPFAGNLCFALFVDRARRLLASPGALRRTNVIAGSLLILVGLVIPFT